MARCDRKLALSCPPTGHFVRSRLRTLRGRCVGQHTKPSSKLDIYRSGGRESLVGQKTYPLSVLLSGKPGAVQST